MSPITIHTSSPLRRILFALSFAVLLCGVTLYVLFQARFLLIGPQITLTETPAILQEERRVTITGVATNIVEITLNGNPIVTDEAGHFAVPVVLENGYTLVTISARDRYGRSVSVTHPLVYKKVAPSLSLSTVTN